MIVTERHYNKDLRDYEKCNGIEEFLPGKCHKCLTLLHINAFSNNRDADDLFWLFDVNTRNNGNWELKENYKDKRFIKEVFYPYNNKKYKSFTYFVEK